jgi:hypothetical protein
MTIQSVSDNHLLPPFVRLLGLMICSMIATDIPLCVVRNMGIQSGGGGVSDTSFTCQVQKLVKLPSYRVLLLTVILLGSTLGRSILGVPVTYYKKLSEYHVRQNRLAATVILGRVGILVVVRTVLAGILSAHVQSGGSMG